MADVMILIILALLIGGAVTYMIRAKRRGVKCIGCPAGGACPGSVKIPKKRLSGRVVARKTMRLEGMHCAHCALEVARALNRIDGVKADVNLPAGTAKIACDREVADDMLKETVEKAGYRVTEIKQA